MDEDMHYEDDDAAYDDWKIDQSWADDMLDDSSAPIGDNPKPFVLPDRADPNYVEPF